MHQSSILIYVFAGLLLSLANASAQEMTKLNELVTGMPQGEKQQIRVLTATLEPGDATVFHTHRFPVTLYVLKGAFTLELEGRSPMTIKAARMALPPSLSVTQL